MENCDFKIIHSCTASACEYDKFDTSRSNIVICSEMGQQTRKKQALLNGRKSFYSKEITAHHCQVINKVRGFNMMEIK